MSNLLQVVRFQPKALQKKGCVPLLVDVPVSPDTAPYLVSSSGSFMWIEEPHPGNLVKAAVRTLKSPGDAFRDVLGMITERATKDAWGCMYPFTVEGVKDALSHLEFYGIEGLEILAPYTRKEVHPKGPYQRPEWLTQEEFGVHVVTSSWVPDDTAVVVPSDRDFLGTLGHMTPKDAIVVVHNASRGISVARGV